MANENLKEAKIQQIINNLMEKKKQTLTFVFFSDQINVKIFQICLQSKLLSLFGRITIFFYHRDSFITDNLFQCKRYENTLKKSYIGSIAEPFLDHPKCIATFKSLSIFVFHGLFSCKHLVCGWWWNRIFVTWTTEFRLRCCYFLVHGASAALSQ